MRTNRTGTLLLVVVVTLAPVAARAQEITRLMVAAGMTDEGGRCAVDFGVDPGLDPQSVADDLQRSLRFTAEATAESISVENGVAHVDCVNGPPSSVVEVWLPAEVVARIGATGEPPEGAVSRTSILGGVLLAAAGLAVGLCVAFGCFGDDDDPRNVRGSR